MDKKALADAVIHDLTHKKHPILYPGLKPDNPQPGKEISMLGIQLTGLCIFLHHDGTWQIEDSTGG